MLAPDEQNWVSIVDDPILHQEELQTIEFLKALTGLLARLTLQSPPYTGQLLPDRFLERASLPRDLVLPRSFDARSTLEELRGYEEILSSRYEPGTLRSYGQLNDHLGRRPIFRGFLDKRRTFPVLERSSSDLVLFLTKIPEVGDFLKRENHSHFGIHYHYLDKRKRRSDTVLCFVPPKNWPLFAEKHAEKGADFPARPRGWSQQKRQSVYQALQSERTRFATKEFRLPTKGSMLVWQVDANSMRERRSGLVLVLNDGSETPASALA